MSWKKAITIAAAAAVLAGLICGCGKKKTENLPVETSTLSEPEAEEMNGMKVGISFPDETSERWVSDANALRELFRSHGYDTKIVYAAQDAARQSSDISALAADGCNLLIIAAVDGNSLTSAMNTVKEAGIPVIAYDRLIRNTDAVADYVGFDDYEIGQMEAKFILDKLGIKGTDTAKVHHIEFAAGDKADLRQGYYYNGAYDVIHPYLDSGALQIMSGEQMFADAICDVQGANENQGDKKNPTAYTVSDLAAARMKRILTDAYPDATQLDAVLCTDDDTAAGVIKAVSSGYSGKNQVVITGMGGSESALSLIRDGKQGMTVTKPPERLHNITAALAISIMKGESPDATLIARNNLGEIIRYDTESYDNGMGVIEAYLAQPVTVTAKTLEGEQ